MLKGKVHNAEDSRWLAELNEGSYVAFQSIYNKYWQDVFNEAYKRLENSDQAKDVVQEIFAGMWTKRETLQIQNLPAWLKIAIRNQVYSVFKRQQKFIPLTTLVDELNTQGESADALLLQKELIRTYQQLIDTLPVQQQAVFNMRYKENKTPDEIAETLNLSSKTVRNHLGRALSKLKTAFRLTILLLMLFRG